MYHLAFGGTHPITLNRFIKHTNVNAMRPEKIQEYRNHFMSLDSCAVHHALCTGTDDRKLPLDPSYYYYYYCIRYLNNLCAKIIFISCINAKYNVYMELAQRRLCVVRLVHIEKFIKWPSNA